MRAVVLLSCLILVGCGSSSSTDSTSSGEVSPPPGPTSVSTTERATGSASPSAPSSSFTPSRSESAEGRTGTTIITADSQFGTMLYDASGQAIYLFDAEQGTQPKCYDDCADAWPPVLTTGKPRAEGEVDSDLLGTTDRTDGTTQVTYAGHPLYFYADEGKYQVLCHNIEGFGGTWLVVQPDGNAAPH